VSDLSTRLRTVTRDLEHERVPFALVGGLAIGAWTPPRFTKDIDVAVAVSTDVEAESLVARLSQRGYRVAQALEHRLSGRLSTVRLVCPGSSSPDPDVDLLFFASGIEDEIVRTARRVRVLGCELPVADLGRLLAQKILASDDARRPQDAIDIHALLRVATDDDLAQTRRALDLITERRCARDKDLAKDLDAVLARMGRRL
jgi:hypothetical protein